MSEVLIADICALACAEAFRGDGEILCNPIGTIPLLGGRLARATFEPELVCTDAVSAAVLGNYPIAEKLNPTIESYVPYRTMFDIVWSGKRHVLMGASQIDTFGNQNIAGIGDWKKPKAQLLGLRGAPGNLLNHKTSYFIPNHSPKSFVPEVDIVSGPGHDKMKELGEPMNRFFSIGRVVSNLGVFTFNNPEGRMQIHSLHPSISYEHVQAETGFELLAPEGEIPETPLPSEEDLMLLNEVFDPKGLRHKELPSN